MATKTEFIAADRTREEVAELLGVDYLLYLDREAMNEAARQGNPEVKQFCNACFTGDYPTGDITREVLSAIEGERQAAQSTFVYGD
jgi:amidophosphoribosyltransferase